MSSALTSLVPVLDGTNFQQWASAMKSYLMSQGQWKCVARPPSFAISSKKAPKASSSKKTDEEEEETPTAVAIPDDDQEAKEAFEELNDKAVGNIRLRLHHSIGYQFNDEDSAHKLWLRLQERYAKPGFTQLFLEFKGVMNTHVPQNADPRPAIDKILAHFTCLRENKLEIPERIQAMILLSKAPSNMEVMVQALAAEASEKEKIDIQVVCQGMISSWQNFGRSGNQTNQQRANKLSAVKRQDDQNPQFQQQQQDQQQRGEGDWRGGRGGRGRRGKRGGKRNQQQQLQQAPVQTEPQPQQPIAGPSNQQNFQFAPGPPNLGYLASPATLPRSEERRVGKEC